MGWRCRDLFDHAEKPCGPSVTFTVCTSKRIRLRGGTPLLAGPVRDRFTSSSRIGKACPAGKAGNPIDQVHEVIGPLVHLLERRSRHETPLGDLLAAADLDHFFGRNQHLVDFVFHRLFGDGLANRLGDLLLEVRQDADRIPTLCHVSIDPCFVVGQPSGARVNSVPPEK